MGYGHKRRRSSTATEDLVPDGSAGIPGGPTNKQPGSSKRKRTCRSPHNSVPKILAQLQHPILSLYFPGTQLQTLRGWLSGQLLDDPVRLQELDLASLSSLLDGILIGTSSTEEQQTQPDILRWEIAAACRVLEDRSEHDHSVVQQDDVVNLVLQILFRRAQRSSSSKGRPNNILCLGYRTGLGDSQLGRWGIPIICSHPNSNVNSLKTSAWERLLGVIGEEVMVRLLLEGSLFMPIDVGENGKEMGAYWQVSGTPISDIIPVPPPNPVQAVNSNVSARSTIKAVAVAVASDRFETSHTPGALSESLKHSLGEIDTCAKPLGMSTTKNKKQNKNLGNILSNNNSLTSSLTGITNTNTTNTSTPTEDPKSRVSSSLPTEPVPKPPKKQPPPKPEEKSLSNIIFVRSRIFYAKPALTKKREVQFGLPHIHVLNRTGTSASSGFSASASFASVTSFADHVLMYIFPRQFGLHNVFTSSTDKSKTTQLFHDYSSREEEIKEVGDWLKEKGIPKRLVGVREMVEVMVKRHQRTSYRELVRYYCPVRGWDGKSDGRDGPEGEPLVQDGEDKFTAYASNHGEVTAFVKAVVKRVIPGAFFGSSRTITTPDDTDDDSEAAKDKEKDPEHNKKLILATIERFIKLRKYESLSLHDCSQGLRLLDFTWLSPTSPSSQKLSLTDTNKRVQLLHEFLYWLIDSFITPLLRGHFYVTESSSDRNRVFYFRHDVWRKLSEPAFERLKLRMFEEVKKEGAEGNKLGVSKIRLLPKEQRGAIRPIVNLRRRSMVWKFGRAKLLPSINTLMTPVYNALTFEKQRNPDMLGSSLFSVGEMYPRLLEYKERLLARSGDCSDLLNSPEKKKKPRLPKLYFAKIDITSAFDTIPQPALLRLIETILTEPDYELHKHVSIAPAGSHQLSKVPQKRWSQSASTSSWAASSGQSTKPSSSNASEEVEGFIKPPLPAKIPHHAILTTPSLPKIATRNELLNLLKTHVTSNTLQIGKKFYQQKTGIPQGSVLSSILCNFFYAELERNHLRFLGEESLLMRLIDDSLLITTEKKKAEKFLKVMHKGLPNYGAAVNPSKTLANFSVSIKGVEIQQVENKDFPYCGNLINTSTLSIRKERRGVNVDDTLTVSYSQRPGEQLLRKVVASFKIQVHKMYFDTTFNGVKGVTKSILNAFKETGMKMHRYIRALKGVGQLMVIRVIKETIRVAWRLLGRKMGKGGLRKGQVEWIGYRAFGIVLGKKQTGYKSVLEWLKIREEESEMPLGVKGGLEMEEFKGWRY